MSIQQTLDSDVAAALLDLAGKLKPIHDEYYAYALAADAQELKHFKKYLRKHSHEKGEQWKDLLFFLNDFIAVSEIPGTPPFSVNLALPVPAILEQIFELETTSRQQIEDVIAEARAANENRVLQFLEDYVEYQTKTEDKIDRLRTLWDTYNGDAYEWQKEI